MISALRFAPRPKVNHDDKLIAQKLIKTIFIYKMTSKNPSPRVYTSANNLSVSGPSGIKFIRNVV